MWQPIFCNVIEQFLFLNLILFNYGTWIHSIIRGDGESLMFVRFINLTISFLERTKNTSMFGQSWVCTFSIIIYSTSVKKINNLMMINMISRILLNIFSIKQPIDLTAELFKTGRCAFVPWTFTLFIYTCRKKSSN